MNLEFPTHLPFPLHSARPTVEDEAEVPELLEALTDFFQQLAPEDASIGRGLDGPDFHVDNNGQEALVGTHLTDVTQEAIVAIIKNIAHPNKAEYVWDLAQNCWVVKWRPI